MKHARPRIEYRHTSFDKLADVTAHNDQILQRGNGCDEQIRLTEFMATLLTLNGHGFPSHNHIFRNGKNAAGKQRS
jgi:hypothetical protein